jgi:murein DD-endopeptidase MepM/ murein hydrolase activator NlpD
VQSPPLRRPITAAVGDRYGPRGATFHAGQDFPAATGTPVTAAASGRVAFAGYDDGWGLTVVLDHGNAVRTRYAHLSATTVSPGASVAAGAQVGRVGATGHATGPHLHFEVTVRGANAAPPFS